MLTTFMSCLRGEGGSGVELLARKMEAFTPDCCSSDELKRYSPLCRCVGLVTSWEIPPRAQERQESTHLWIVFSQASVPELPPPKAPHLSSCS